MKGFTAGSSIYSEHCGCGLLQSVLLLYVVSFLLLPLWKKLSGTASQNVPTETINDILWYLLFTKVWAKANSK